MKTIQLIRPTGVFFLGECELQLEGCTARTPAPITAVKAVPDEAQINVCRSCMRRMVREGDWEVPGAHIEARPDIALYDPTGADILAVEVKRAPSNPPGDLSAWAIRIRRNMLLHEIVRRVPYFMVWIVPGPVFLWTPDQSRSPEESPRHRFSLDDELRLGSPDPSVREIEDAVSVWLASRVQEARRGELPAPWDGVEGLSQALALGTVVRGHPSSE